MNKMFISCKESIIENNRSFYGSFSMGPFTETQSLTLANALRRTLLSECPGLGIISVLIEDVTHEYSTLSGVRDSVLDIMLNLKEIVLKKTHNPWLVYKQKGISSVYNNVSESYFKPMIGYLKVKGPGIVRAKDLRLPPFIQLVDPEQYIATLSENGVLNMKVVIMEGKNYIIQKNTEFIDYSLVKKRRTLFKNLKELVNNSTHPLLNSSKTMIGKKNLKLKTGLNAEALSKSANQVNPNDSDFNYAYFNTFKNASPLNIDAVFNPIKKVNYILEVNDNKIVDQLADKAGFIDEISKFMESSDLYKRQFPFLSDTYSSLLPENSVNANTSFTGTLRGPQESKERVEGTPEAHSGLELSQKSKPQTSILRNPKFITALINYIDDYSTEELGGYSNTFHPLRKEGTLNNVTVEIWTNGSIHPREALSLAFSKLTNLFCSVEKTRMFSPMYKDISSYKKALRYLSSAPKEGSVSDTQKTSVFKREQLGNPLLNEHFDISILNLNLRAYTNLKRANIHTIQDLLEWLPSVTKEELLNEFALDYTTVEQLLKLVK